MTKAQAIEAARNKLLAESVKLRSDDPSLVRENAKMICGGNVRGWHIVFDLDMTGVPEWIDTDFIMVEVHEPSGEVLVLPNL